MAHTSRQVRRSATARAETAPAPRCKQGAGRCPRGRIHSSEEGSRPQKIRNNSLRRNGRGGIGCLRVFARTIECGTAGEVAPARFPAFLGEVQMSERQQRRMELLSWEPGGSGALIGRARVRLPSGLEIADVAI